MTVTSDPITLSELTETILSRLREQLGDRWITGEDNFLDVGGHSMMAIELKAWLADRHGVSIGLPELFRGTLSDAAAAAFSGKGPVK
ncbi:acyl carrier protein [Streptomyces sp. NPDC054841]